MSQSDETPYKAPSPYGRDSSPAPDSTPPTPPAPPVPPAGGNSPYANSPYANSPYGQVPQSNPGVSHDQSPYVNSPYAQNPYAQQGSFGADGNAPAYTDEAKKKANWGIAFGIIGLFFFQVLFGTLAIIWGKKANELGGNGKPAIILGCVDLAFFVIAIIYGLSNR